MKRNEMILKTNTKNQSNNRMAYAMQHTQDKCQHTTIQYVQYVLQISKFKFMLTLEISGTYTSLSVCMYPA